MIKTEDKYFIFDKPRNENLIYKIKYIITFIQCIYYRLIKLVFRKKANDKKILCIYLWNI